MKKANESVKSVKVENETFSNFSEDQILNQHAMSCVRGGDLDGGDPIIIIPPKR